MGKSVKIIELVKPSRELRELEDSINRELAASFPGAGPVRLFQTSDGEIGVRLTVEVKSGKKRLLDEIYQFVMERIGQRRGRSPGERKIQVKYRLPEELHRRVQDAAAKGHVSASDLVATCLREKLGR